MAVGVDKAVRIHEAKVFRLVIRCASGGEGLRDEVIHLLATLATEADQDFHRLGRIADGLRREFAELGMRRQHDVDRLADDDARTSVAGHLRIMGETKCLEKGEGPRQIGDGNVESNLFDHVRRGSTTPSTNERADAGHGVGFCPTSRLSTPKSFRSTPRLIPSTPQSIRSTRK